jgi:hypothetical protein
MLLLVVLVVVAGRAKQRHWHRIRKQKGYLVT